MITYVNKENKMTTVLILSPYENLNYMDMMMADYVFRENKQGHLEVIKTRQIIEIKTKGM